VKQRRTILLSSLLIATVLYAVVAGCAHKQSADNKPAPPVTRWEQINLTNAEIAIFNDGVAQGLIAANNAGALEDEYTAQVTQVQFQVAAWQKQLTPMLKDLKTAQSNAARIQAITSNIGTATNNLIKSGNAGIKNAQNAQQLTQALTSLQTTISSLTSLLTQAGVLKS